jgi:nucleoid-associated protein YgaU
VIEEPTTPFDAGPSACPFVAFEDDRDHRSNSPDYRHRCFAAPEPEPRAFPHQERYCLSADFARCPVFLDWARQEAAGVKVAGALAGAAVTAEDEAAASLGTDDDAGPAFLAGRPRPTANPDLASPSKRKSEAAASLWSYDGDTKRTPSTPAPTPPSSLGPPSIAMARRGPSHPGWENPPRVDSYPRLRSREDRRANQPLLFVSIGIALIFVALVMFPILTKSPGGIGGASGSPIPLGSFVVPSFAPSPSGGVPTPGISYAVYHVKSGDYLQKIATQFNLHLWEIQLANPQITNFDHIQVGDPINIPPAGLLTQPPASLSPSPTN